MSRLRTRQVSRFILVSALTLALTLPAAAQPFDRLDLASMWHTLQSWLRPEASPLQPPGLLEAAALMEGAGRDPNGAAVSTEPPPDTQAEAPVSPTSDTR